MTEAMPFLQKAILLSYAPRPFGGGYFFPVAPGESKFIPVRGNPRWSTKIEKTSNPLRLLVFLYLSMLCGAFGKLFGAKNVADLRLFSA